MPYAVRGPVCALENCQWCGEPCSAGAAISLDMYLPQNPGGAGISHYRPNQGFVEGPRYISSARAAQGTPLQTDFLLLGVSVA
jgi:hypothetical protein